MSNVWQISDSQISVIINSIGDLVRGFGGHAGSFVPGAVPGGTQSIAAFTRGLRAYWALLGLWNDRINLTAVRDPLEALQRHALDSLVASAFIPRTCGTLVDVGSGAGFPGAIMALARPEVAFTLVESNHKKSAFLGALRRELPLGNVSVEAARIESFVERGATFDAASSRATLDLPEWLALGRKLAPKGRVIGMEGGEPRSLPQGAMRHPYPLGASRLAIITWDA